MRYLLLICNDETAEPYDAAEDNIEEWVKNNDERGISVIGDRLADASATVKRRGGTVVVTDGPYTETKELIAGFDVIEVADRDEAIAVASAHPMARFGQVVVREFDPLHVGE
jgi:hypothetical protein